MMLMMIIMILVLMTHNWLLCVFFILLSLSLFVSSFLLIFWSVLQEENDCGWSQHQTEKEDKDCIINTRGFYGGKKRSHHQEEEEEGWEGRRRQGQLFHSLPFFPFTSVCFFFVLCPQFLLMYWFHVSVKKNPFLFAFCFHHQEDGKGRRRRKRSKEWNDDQGEDDHRVITDHHRLQNHHHLPHRME